MPRRCPNILALLCCLLPACGGSAGPAPTPPIQVDGNGDFVVPTHLLDEYSLFTSDFDGAYGQLESSQDMREAYVYHQFNRGGAISLSTSTVKFISRTAGSTRGLAESAAQEIGAFLEGNGHFVDNSPEVSYDSYSFSYGGAISLDRLFLNSLHLVESNAGLFAVEVEADLVLP